MRICFLIPDGVGIRNYLYSDVIPLLVNRGHEIILWHSLDSELISGTEDRLQVKFEQVEFVHKPNSAVIQLFREAARFARLKKNAKLKDNPTILQNWSKGDSTVKGRLLSHFAEILGFFYRDYAHIERLELREFELLKKTNEFEECRDTLLKIRPDVLFCTHQRVFSVTAAIEAAKSLGIPTSTAIFSWDNLPKGRLPFRTDQFLVWSNYMKEELENFYPQIDQSKIKITGTPQFDFYFKQGMVLDKVSFAERFGLDPTKTWVCFSGCDSLTSPNDPKYLRDTAQGLQGDPSIQLIFRPVPVESTRRFHEVLKCFPSIKLLKPLWKKGDHWGNYFPLYEDIQMLVNLAYHCPVVINLGSTMALDFSTFGNIGLYLRYDHEDGVKGWSVKTIYQFQHFRSMENWKAVGFIDSPDSISEMVSRSISNPEQIAPDRKKWFSRIVNPNPKITAAQRVSDAILSLVQT